MLDAGSTTGTTGADRPSRAARAVRTLSLLGLYFLIGGLFGVFGLQPIRFMAEGLLATRVLVEELTRTRPELLFPITHPGEGVVTHDPARASAGLTLVQGLLPGGPQVRLIDMSGRERHRWEVDFFAAWDEPDHIVPPEHVPKSRLNYHTQGFAVRPDGSMLVIVGEKGAIKLDRCGRILWTVDRMVHHAVTPAPDGGYWLPSHIPIDQAEESLLAPQMSRQQVIERATIRRHNPVNTVLKLDSAGRSVKEFTILEAIQNAGLDAALYDARAMMPTDPTHLNEIELVTPALADKLPGVEPGDLLVSLRTMNMLAILDRDDGALKWHKRGPWVRQHDPDIRPDGVIELFNNRSHRIGRHVEGSQILAYDPETDQTTVLHPKGPEDSFYADFMGSHQRLPNGNRLIVESTRGRVFEATPAGEVVWSYVLPYDDSHAALIEHAERVPPDFFTVENWACGDAPAETRG